MLRSRLPAAAHAAALLGLAAAVVLPIGHAGIGEPFELETAELARRVASTHLGGGALRQMSDPALPPTLGDVGMGELPIGAIALSFRLLGLETWAGRLPMALFGLGGLLATAALVSRFAGRRAGLVAAAVLATCPVYALQARTMLGDAASLGAFAAATAGLGGVLLDPARRARWGWALLGGLGLLGGFASRGLLLGVASPLLAVGAAGLAVARVLPPDRGAQRRLGSLAALAGGLLAAFVFAWRAVPLLGGEEGTVLRSVGVALGGARPGEGTFDRPLRDAGLALFPWSALLPLALARLTSVPEPAGRAEVVELAPDSGLSLGSAERAALALYLAACVGTSLLANMVLAPYAANLPWLGVAPAAAAVALAFDPKDARPISPAAGLLTAFAAVVLAADVAREPARVLAAYARSNPLFPATLAEEAPRWLLAAATAFVLPVALSAWSEPASVAPQRTDAELSSLRRRARAAAAELAGVWDGWLVFAAVVLQAALVGLAAMVFLGEALRWATIAALSQWTRTAFTHAFWAVPMLVVGAPLGLLALRAGLARAARACGWAPRTLASLLAVLAASTLTLGLLPAAAARSSPKEALESYRALRSADETLGLVGIAPEVALFHGGGGVRPFGTVAAAFPWFAGDAPGGEGTARRWLVVKARDLGKANALHRARFGRNAAVANARGQSVLLASAPGGFPDRNPLADVVLDAPRPPARPRAAQLETAIAVIGWEIVDVDGAVVESVAARERYRARFHVRLLAPVAPSFRPFLHVDRGKQRWNGDDLFVDRGYPPALWQVGDVIVLECALRLDANFGAGDYEVFFGFFSGASRMAVTEGPASADRVRMGVLRVQ